MSLSLHFPLFLFFCFYTNVEENPLKPIVSFILQFFLYFFCFLFLVVWHSWHSSALKWRLFSRLSLKFSSSPFIGTGTNSKVWFLWYDRKHFWKARIWVLKYFNDLFILCSEYWKFKLDIYKCHHYKTFFLKKLSFSTLVLKVLTFKELYNE